MKRVLHTWNFILLAICLLQSYCLQAQTFKAQIENVEGGYYRLTYTVTSSNVSGFTPPSLANFDVLSDLSTSTFNNYQYINGHASHTEGTTFTYIISARKSGHQTIGPATIRVNGKTLRSNAISFKAHAGSANGGGNGNNTHGQHNVQGATVQQAGSSVTQQDLFIDVTPSRTQIREQEAVLLTYRIHARVGVGLSNTSLTQKPDFKGLISQEIPLPGNQIQTTLEHRGGRTYRTGTILQYVVFPQKSGKITIPSITFDCAVVQQDNTMDLADAFFNGGGTISVQVRRTVAPITLNVEPLPQPRPTNFSGAVGKFSIQAQLLNKSVKTNDVATYRITLNGLGNLKLITAPQVKFPSDFDTYDAKTTDNTQTTANGLHGQLVFDYTFVPRNVGDYTIPATDFVFFDTGSGTYKTIRTQPIQLHVAKGEKSNADIDKQMALLKSDIHSLHAVQPSVLPLWGTWTYRVLFALVIVIGMLFIILTNQWNKKKNSAYGQRHRAAQNAIKQMRNATSANNIHAELLKCIHQYLIATFNLKVTDLNIEHIKQVLSDNGVNEQDINQLSSIIDNCQFAQYAPSSSHDSQSLIQQTIQVIEHIDKESQMHKNN